MKHIQTILMSTAIIAMSLMLTNSSFANAQTANLDDADRRAIAAIEKKQLEAATKMMKILEEYRETLRQHSFENPNTDRRVMEKTTSIESGISQVIKTLTDISTAPEDGFSEPNLKQVALGKFRSTMPDTYKVTYKVYAADEGLDNVRLMVFSDLDNKQQPVGNIFPNSGTTATFLIKAKDPSSINAEIID